MKSSEIEPADALELIKAERHQIAERWIGVWWWYPLLGLLYFAFIASLETRRIAVILPVELIWAVGQGLMARWHVRRTRLWVGLRRIPRAGLRSYGLVVAVGALIGLAAIVEHYSGLRGAFVGAGAVAAALFITIGPRVEAAAREEIRNGR